MPPNDNNLQQTAGRGLLIGTLTISTADAFNLAAAIRDDKSIADDLLCAHLRPEGDGILVGDSDAAQTFPLEAESMWIKRAGTTEVALHYAAAIK
jgi:hypothetical protein